MRNTKSGFSLIEILVGMLIVSIIMVSAFQALSSVGIAKVKLIERTEIEKNAYFASERFFEMIKKGGQLDYEEYWNRYSSNTLYGSGHFTQTSGFGNKGTLYYCYSPDGSSMGTGGCLQAGDQKYGEYEQQFIDRNGDEDGGRTCVRADGTSYTGDVGDEDCDGSILGDDDDLFLGKGPAAFPDNQVGELYLINSEGNERTYFRWNVREDPDATITETCSGTENMTGDGCLGTIEFLKLTGKDTTANGLIDTWYIHNDFNPGGGDVVAGSDNTNYWQPIFPDSIHVSDVAFYAYPNKDLEYAWRDGDSSVFVAPYVQIRMSLQPSIKGKRKIRGAAPVVNIATTIQLSSLDLK